MMKTQFASRMCGHLMSNLMSRNNSTSAECSACAGGKGDCACEVIEPAASCAHAAFQSESNC